MPGRDRKRELQVTRLLLAAALSCSVAALSLIVAFILATAHAHTSEGFFLLTGSMSGISGFLALHASFEIKR